ncbi:Fc.00g043270.m01.CDS01 [Cosmosporella sp. VM-42]
MPSSTPPVVLRRRRGRGQTAKFARDEPLSDQILKRFEKSKFDSKPCEFAPEGEVDDLINKQSILKAFGVETSMENEDLVDFILRKARKIFVIWVQSGLDGHALHKVMRGFKVHDFCDKELPIKDPRTCPPYADEEEDFAGDGNDSEYYEVNGDEECDIRDDEIGTYDEADDENTGFHKMASLAGETGELLLPLSRITHFYNTQWQFLVPVFSTTNFNYDLEADSILPFTSKVGCGEGAFSRVFKVQIHEAHYKDLEQTTEPRPKYFAIKEIRPANAEDRQNVENSWESEARNLQRMNKLNQPHIIRFITGLRRGHRGEESYHLMFEWADRGSLRDFWMTNSPPNLDATLMRELMRQLLGLANALCAAHNLDKTGSFRHGDLKPENILCFKSDTPFGTLKIGDWGLAKQHNVLTHMRSKNSSTRHGTIRYEPPEVVTGLPLSDGQVTHRISRLYDIWAMGCVILEFMIWLLYGYEELLRFNINVKGKSLKDGPCYQFKNENGRQEPKVHDVVVQWMDHMAKDRICANGNAMGDLLQIVRTRLLVVPLPPRMGSFEVDEPNSQRLNIAIPVTPPRKNYEQPAGAYSQPSIVVAPPESREPSPPHHPGPIPGPYRALAAGFRDALASILDRQIGTDGYWYKESRNDRKGPRDATDSAGHDSLLPPTAEEAKKVQAKANVISRVSRSNCKHVKLTFGVVAAAPLETLPRLSSQLCSSCLELDFWSPAFSILYQTQELEGKSTACDLCNLFWTMCKREGATKHPTVQFDRVQSSITLNGGGPPILSIYRSPGMFHLPPRHQHILRAKCSLAVADLKARVDIQIGFPKLPEAASQTHFEVMRQWLILCNEKHPNCRSNALDSSVRTREVRRLPTRLINVGNDGDKTVRVWETCQADSIEYIALSHPWGNGPYFSTTLDNYDKHKLGINIENLPLTFRDAVTTTRALGVQHLWIDSICILQGPGGDFNNEAKRMESVFSQAYCVIAASRSTGHFDGFLQARKERKYVTVRRDNRELFYVCENIDDFNKHVDLAAFLGDPNFPRIIMSASQGEKIIRYQDLYKKYSRLAFSEAYDRAIAIHGLENRLLNAFGTSGGFGVFDEGDRGGLLRRSLLWYNKSDRCQLSRIMRPPDRSIIVPSWSWMAYTGEIDYLQLDFNGIEWEDLRSPWTRNSDQPSQTETRGGNIALKATVRDLRLNLALDQDGQLFFDMPGGSERKGLQGVVLGTQKGRNPIEPKESKIHYLILVVPTNGRGRDGSNIYERHGVGYLPGKCIGPKGPVISIH